MMKGFYDGINFPVYQSFFRVEIVQAQAESKTMAKLPEMELRNFCKAKKRNRHFYRGFYSLV